MDVHLTSQTEQKLKEIAAKTGRGADEVVESAVAGYVQELMQVEEMLDRSYADLDSGRKKLSSDEAETYYRRKIAAEHDASFRAAIQEALDDPRPLVPHAEVEAHFAKRRSDALSKVE
jgi:predicted transcriptional regulator